MHVRTKLSGGPIKGYTNNSGTKLKTTAMYKTSMCDNLSLALWWGFTDHTLTNMHDNTRTTTTKVSEGNTLTSTLASWVIRP